MNCQWVEHGDIAERYVAGTLPEADRDAFEEHFFSCEACLARLETLQHTAALVGAAAPATSRGGRYWPLAVAAGLMVVLGVTFQMTTRRTEQPIQVAQAPKAAAPAANPWAELSRFDAPEYRTALVRGTAPSADFRAGMAAYQKRDFASAAASLRQAADRNPKDAAAGFFAGVSELLAGNAAAGIQRLAAVDSMGFTPYQEEARFYRAKGLLQTGDAEGARKALEAVAAMRGDLETAAKDLLTKLR